MTDTVAIFASANSNGNTRQLMDWISHELDIKVIDLNDKNISSYDYEHKNINDDFMSVMNEILEYEKVIFATPIYWYSMSAQMKSFIDRTTDFLQLEEFKHVGRKLRNRTSYVICTSASEEADSDFLSVFAKTFGYLGINYKGHIHANCSDGFIAERYTSDVDKFITLVQR